jgi:hypothetical protein
MFSVLALISADKINIFNDRLLNLVDHILENWNSDKDQAAIATLSLDKMVL